MLANCAQISAGMACGPFIVISSIGSNPNDEPELPPSTEEAVTGLLTVDDPDEEEDEDEDDEEEVARAVLCVDVDWDREEVELELELDEVDLDEELEVDLPDDPARREAAAASLAAWAAAS